MKHYYLTLNPENAGDRRRFRKIMRNIDPATNAPRYMPRDNEGRMPFSVEYYSAWGWNEFDQCWAAFERGEKVWFEAWED